MIALIISCSAPKEEKPRPTDLQGEWKAEWVTPPESYPGITDVEFTMTGKFVFTADSLTVQANGFDGCIFYSDTLSHTQSWFVRNDSLFLLTDPETVGMTYQIKARTEEVIELQLLEDIFVTLRKKI